MNNVMLDLETFGTKPGSVIRSVGAVMFDPYSDKLGMEFYMNVDDETCRRAGLTEDQSTIDWWKDPRRAKANDMLKVDQKPVMQVCNEFITWFRKNAGVFLWSQGSNFDGVLLECVFTSVGLRTPWKFSDTRDTRTAYDIARFNSYGVRRAGTYHNALDDAKHQARCVQASYAKIGVR